MCNLIIAMMLAVGPFLQSDVQDAAASRPAGPHATAAAEDFSDVAAVAVVEVVSGDSIVVESRRGRVAVRCLGVQVRRSDDTAREPAHEFLTHLLTGEEVYLKYERPAHSEEDPRRAYVFRAPDGLFVNAELIRQGYAAVDATVATRFREEFEVCERRARASAKGIWAILNAARPPATQPASRPTASQAAEAPRAPAAASQPVDAPPKSSGPAAASVYITRSGSKYHRADCSFVRKGATAISLQDAVDKGLTPCSRCKP